MSARHATPARVAWLLVAGVALLAVCAASLAVGTRDVPIGSVVHALWDFSGTEDEVVVRAARLPRTVLGLVVGAAIGVGGALIQALTRNPLGDPVILGITPGATLAVALAVGVFSLTAVEQYLWFALAGSAVAVVVVSVVGRSGRIGATPLHLTLAGVAVGAVCTGLTLGITLLDPPAFDRMRYWEAGSLIGRGWDVVLAVAPFVAVGLLVAAAIGRGLDAVALGDDAARAVGASVVRLRILGLAAVTLLCGAAAAAAGPIVFVGLMIPHVARWLLGPSQRWILAFSCVAAPALLLTSDVLGRVALRPAELPVGIVSAFLGAPVLIWLARRHTAVPR